MLILAATTAMAQPVFNAMYFIHVTVNANGAPGGVDGRNVVFYESYPTVVRGIVGPPLMPAGRAAINVYNNEHVIIRDGVTYFVAVERGADNWGADPVPVTVRLEGHNNVTLNMAEGAGPGGNTEAPDDGLINNSTITRHDDGSIRLSWTLNGAANAVIWRMEADADTDEFSAVTDNYVLAGGPYDGGTLTWTDGDARTGNGRTFYYRIVPEGVAHADIFGADAAGRDYNRRTLGKIDLRLVEGYNLLCYPFNAATIDLPTLVGDQLMIGDQLHRWDVGTQQYGIITRRSAGSAADNWNAVHNFDLGDGFFVYVVPGSELVPPIPARTVQLTLVGLVDNFAAGLTYPLGREYNLIGFACPVIRDAGAAGFLPRVGDQMHIWYPDALRPPPPPEHRGQEFGIATFLAARTWNNPSMVNLAVGEGKFYYIPTDLAPFDWRPVYPRY